MKTIHITASKSYDVLIGAGLLNELGQHLLSVLNKPCKIAIISDSNVWPHYGKIAETALTDAGFSVVNFVFPAGEASKNADTYLNILNFLAENHLTRSDAVLALGGGVTGDMTGFAAATFLRGIRYIQVPTTLLAMVDSSVGGKTAIDLPAGKNLVGAFYQPNLVLCDLDTLHTLPNSVFCDGCAEVIKYGVLYDHDLFEHLAKNGLNFDQETVIARCVELKRNVVAEDEFDTGARQKLNLGHTIGHGVEAQSNFSITHGQAVAIGMALISRASARYGICSDETCCQILSLLNRFGLPCSAEYPAEALFAAACSDKKRSGGTINLIVPQAVGTCFVRSTPISELQSFIEAGF